MAPHATDIANGRSGFDVVQALTKYGVDINSSLQGDGETAASTLAKLYPKQIITTAADTEAWRKQFWSVNQRDAKPTLIFQPESAKDVAIALLVCRFAQAKFAVKSGGHAAMKGASSADGGIVIDLKKLNMIELSDNKKIAKLGAGNKWESVFEELAKDGLAVAGGRTADVGVGGYTLGGGISFFASARGWACDNVRNFELVTAQGEILNVNYQTNPDLFWALRGGGPNFGIVTRFDYETFPQGDIYAGSLFYDYEHKDAVVKAFSSFARDADPKGATWLGAAQIDGKKLFTVLSMHSEPTGDCEMVRTYNAIPSLQSGHKIRSLTDMVREVANSNIQDHRQYFWNRTFKFDADFVAWLCDAYYAEMSHEVDRADSRNAALILLQFFTKEAVSFMRREGGNCLPLTVDDAPYVNLLIPTSWAHENDDEFVYDVARKFMDIAVAEGKRRGLYVDFVYMNYGSCYQDVLKSYGKENYERLREVASKHDPEGVFQKLTPGYFKFGDVWQIGALLFWLLTNGITGPEDPGPKRIAPDALDDDETQVVSIAGPVDLGRIEGAGVFSNVVYPPLRRYEKELKDICARSLNWNQSYRPTLRKMRQEILDYLQADPTIDSGRSLGPMQPVRIKYIRFLAFCVICQRPETDRLLKPPGKN
ncbi:FAD-binding domain-containing protein [Decorospora gaudefroyi]|uniref:FAD-binding domain-containing protein n=1 Tax=Decorospora gaudefroyi TaxID=184978 RepID=A0A6A5K0L9_9PLEO|nr:FAD-binding domain-containing protein [Decorospora gaudefroyi]